MGTGVKAVLVRHMPEDLHKAAKVCAVSAGISLEQWIIQAIRRQVGEDQPNITLIMTTAEGDK
jgi:HicB family